MSPLRLPRSLATGYTSIGLTPALGHLDRVVGRYDLAERELRRAPEILDGLMGEQGQNWDTLSARVDCLDQLADVLIQEEQLEEAELLLHQAQHDSQVLVMAYPPEHEGFQLREFVLRDHLATVQYASGRTRKAEEAYRGLIVDWETVVRGHPELRRAHRALADLYTSCPVLALRDPARARCCTTKKQKSLSPDTGAGYRGENPRAARVMATGATGGKSYL